MLPIAIHRFLYRLSPASVRNYLKNQIPFGVTCFPLELPDGQTLIFDHLGSSKILRRFAWKGIHGHEPDTIRLFQALAKRAHGVLDIGAYFGLYALIAARANPNAVIHAFEPVPDNLQLLRHFQALNQSTGIVTQPVAIAPESGNATFYIPARRRSALPPTGSLKNCFGKGERFEDNKMQTLQVKTKPLDSLIENIGRIDLVKIDTEETERDVIFSGANMFRRDRPDIVMEVIFGNPQVDDVLVFLHQLGYRCFHIDACGLTPFDQSYPKSYKEAALEDITGCEIFCTVGDSDMPHY